MRRRLLISMLAVAVAAVLALGIPLGFVLGRLQVDDANQALHNDARDLARNLYERQQSADGIDASYAADQGRALVGRYVIIRMARGFTTTAGTRPTRRDYLHATVSEPATNPMFVVTVEADDSYL